MKEGQGSGQHGEDRILKLVFRDRPTGLLVDAGAADGWANSNSIMLLQRPGWRGVLIEPEPVQFQKLQQRYKDRHGVTCANLAVGKTSGQRTFYCGGQVSTFCPEVKHSAEVNHGIVYSEIKVRMVPLSELLLNLGIREPIDFLTIDVEGMNYEVWQTVNTSIHSPGLVCIEGHGYAMHGYRELARLGCNTFYLREDLCNQL